MASTAAAGSFGKSSLIAYESSGAVMIKITSSTSITSTSGVTLISDIGCAGPLYRSKPPKAIRSPPANASR